MQWPGAIALFCNQFEVRLVAAAAAGAEANSTPQRPEISLVTIGTAISAVGSALTIARYRARSAAALRTRSAARQPQN